MWIFTSPHNKKGFVLLWTAATHGFDSLFCFQRFLVGSDYNLATLYAHLDNQWEKSFNI